MNKKACDEELERRRTLIIQERALRDKFKRKIQQIAEVADENDRREHRCRTLRKMIEELPDKPAEHEFELSLYDECKEVQQIAKPELLLTDEVRMETPNDEYKVHADIILSVRDYIKKSDRPIKPFSITYKFNNNAITREVNSSWGKHMTTTTIKTETSASF